MYVLHMECEKARVGRNQLNRSVLLLANNRELNWKKSRSWQIERGLEHEIQTTNKLEMEVIFIRYSSIRTVNERFVKFILLLLILVLTDNWVEYHIIKGEWNGCSQKKTHHKWGKSEISCVFQVGNI